MLGFFSKVLIVVILIILIRGSLPRARIDQLTSESWKSFIFTYLGYFFVILSVVCLTYCCDLSWTLEVGIRSFDINGL